MKITLTATLNDGFDTPVEITYSRTLPKPFVPEYGEEGYGDSRVKADWTFAQSTLNELSDEVLAEFVKGVDLYSRADKARVETENQKKAAAREQKAREAAEKAATTP